MGETKHMKELKLSGPVEGIRPSEMEGISDLMYAYEKMSFQARTLGKAASVFTKMCSNDDVFVIMTLAGALVPGGMRNVVQDAIEHGLVDVIISTGANMSHDVLEGMGHHHYRKCNFKKDEDLREAFVDRVYDTFITEQAFTDAAEELEEHFENMELSSSDEICRYLGSVMENPCILKSAYENDVPIFIPALNDSELGLVMNHFNYKNDEANIRWDGLEDNMRFARLINSAEEYGIIICGGGVPKNWAQQVTPLLEYLNYVPGEWVHRFEGYKYGVSITTDTPVYGGLSGCTFSESVTWGKYAPDSEYVTVNCDVTIALPMIVGAAIERMQ